jgi:glucosamine-6-phosphate deaminase
VTMSPCVMAVDDERFGASAADAVSSRLPDLRPRLGVATGGTPTRLYTELARRSQAGEIDLSEATLVSLDEYVGLGAGDPRSYAAYVRTEIADPFRVPPHNVVVPYGLAADPDGEAAAFEARIIGLGGVDVQILGIGGNGHLAFNEPGSPFDSPTRVVTLTDETRIDNARFFDGVVADVPRRAITQGLATIGDARSIVLLARGSHKAVALRAALRGPVTPDVPASMLQRHDDVTVVADRAAARLLTED